MLIILLVISYTNSNEYSSKCNIRKCFYCNPNTAYSSPLGDKTIIKKKRRPIRSLKDCQYGDCKYYIRVMDRVNDKILEQLLTGEREEEKAINLKESQGRLEFEEI